MLSTIKQFVMDYVTENRNEFYEVSRKIWENPELGMQEYKASGWLIELLRKNGFTVEENVAGMPTAFVASFGKGTPVIGFSSEYDALPGLSQKLTSIKAPNAEGAPGHGCGHNLIAVGGILAAVAVKAAIDKFNLTAAIKVYGTPAEEICIGKPIMGSAGIFSDADIILDWHPLVKNAASYVTCPAYFSIKYHFKGKTSHGNSPWHGRSALDAALLQAHAVELLREHIKPGPDEFAAHTINYTFPDVGPEFPSVVPDRTTAWYIGRFTTSEEMAETMKRLDKCADGAAIATETIVEKEYISATHEMIPNETASKVVYDNYIEIGAVNFTDEEKEFVADMQKNADVARYLAEGIEPFGGGYMGLTDSSEYSWNAPFAIAQVALGPGLAWHNWMVTACAGNTHGEKAIDKAAKLLGISAIDFILDNELVVKAKREFHQKLQGKSYNSLLPVGTPIPLDINSGAMQKYRTSE